MRLAHKEYWILDEHGKPAPVDDILTWARWFESHDAERIVQKTEIGRVLVSTVFLGMDHRWGLGGPPLLYETLVFGGKLDGEMERYCTKAQALKGHQVMVERVENGE